MQCTNDNANGFGSREKAHFHKNCITSKYLSNVGLVESSSPHMAMTPLIETGGSYLSKFAGASKLLKCVHKYP